MGNTNRTVVAVVSGIRRGALLKDIATELGVSKQYVDQVVTRLVRDGTLNRVARGKYVVTETTEEGETDGDD